MTLSPTRLLISYQFPYNLPPSRLKPPSYHSHDTIPDNFYFASSPADYPLPVRVHLLLIGRAAIGDLCGLRQGSS